uniref:Glycoside hydrolase family 127 protein n=1 Tax=Dictyoglomus thermophilum TaxID=14 RepID=A0A7C3RMU1_DICTH
MNRSFVIDTTKSPYAKLKTIPISSVKVSGFWGKRIIILHDVTLPEQYRLLEETQRLYNFRRAVGKVERDYFGFFFNDTDVYKWQEAVSFSFASYGRDENLEKILDQTIEEVAETQDEDGYLDTYFTFERKKDRWTNLKDMHELYCAGHLIQAGIAHHRTSGKDTLLNIAKRFADHIDHVFGPGKKEGTCGHPEIEMALVELYRETGDKRYLNLAKFFIDERGKGLIGGETYHIDHKSFRELTEIVGHAVRALYLNCGATDLYLETGEKELMEALERLWKNFVEKKMYITGGAGARHEGEAFGEEYELPNDTAYAETCAAIGSFMWNFRMLLAKGEGRFADIMEQTLYNGLLSGISLNGKEYFYVNPLENNGEHIRKPWFACACCPPNIARLIASIPGYFYTTSEEGIWVHLYGENEAQIPWRDKEVRLIEKTNYPWEGNIEFEIKTEGEYKIFLRIPSWAKGYTIKINGNHLNTKEIRNGYIEIENQWKEGDKINLRLPMEIEIIESHPKVKDNIGKVAIKRGPIVYCMEQVDNSWGDPRYMEISEYNLKAELSEILGGIVTIKGKGKIINSRIWESNLYLPKEEVEKNKKEVEFIAIPYYAWANREKGPMTVWIRKG